MFRRIAVFVSVWLALIVLLAHAAPMRAAQAQAVPSAESWAGQLEGLTRFVQGQRAQTPCKERCFVVDRLRVTGAVGKGPIGFEIEGGVLTDGPVAVPLFGPPGKVRILQATLDGVAGKRVPIGFEGDHYFLFTGAPHFVVRGTLDLGTELAMSIPGPLNAFEAELSSGRVAEGAHLSGVTATTVHFDAAAEGTRAAEPPVFQLSRAVRIGKESAFEYRLLVRSGTDLGVLKLPLSKSERVIDVSGVTGWRVDAGELVFPVAGRSAEIVVTGTLPTLGAFAPDPRSAYEWVLVESDAEHRLTVTGEARQVDAAESPIKRSQPSARLYLLQRGQSLNVSSVALASTEVLAAIVKRHQRTVVVTRGGELVADDTLAYENNGIDYLAVEARGRPIFLSTDGRAERIMQEGKDAILVPLRSGSHTTRIQTLADAVVAPLAGVLDIPVPRYPLTASSAALTVGVPHGMIPLLLLGGDRVQAVFGETDVVALGVAVALAALLLRGVRERVFGAFGLAGLWVFAPSGFVLVVVAVVALGVFRVMVKLQRGWRIALGLVAAGSLGLAAIGALVALAERRPSTESAVAMRAASPPPPPSEETAEESPEVAGGTRSRAPASKLDGYRAQGGGGILQGVTPVELPLPSFARSMSVTRELVTPERPFRPRLVYVGVWGLAPAVGLWVACLLLLALHYRAALLRGVTRLRELFAA